MKPDRDALPIAAAYRAALARYRLAVQNIRKGSRLPWTTIEETLAEAGKSFEELVRDGLTSDVATAHPGEPCGRRGCRGRLRIVKTRRIGSWVEQHLRCGRCGWRPENAKRVLPGELVPRRKGRRDKRLNLIHPALHPGRRAGRMKRETERLLE